MPVDAPTAGLLTEVRNHRRRLERERAVAVAQRDVHAGIAEGHNVGTPGPAQIGEQAWMLIDAPSGVEAEIGDHETRGLKSAVAIAERDVDARIAETHDVRAAVSGEVAAETGM